MSGPKVASRFQRKPKTQTARARRAFRPGVFGHRLARALGEHAYVSRLTVGDLDPKTSDDPNGLYDHRTIQRLADAVGERYHGPLWLVFEAGRGDVFSPDGGKLHAHAVHHRSDGPAHIERDTLRCRWVHDPLNLWRYLYKHDPATRELMLEHAVAELLSPSGRAPNVRRPFWSRKRLLWVESTALYDQTFSELPPVLACGMCRDRHLPPCPSYGAAAAAAARNGARSHLSGHFDGWGFTDTTPPPEGRIFIPNGFAAAASPLAGSQPAQPDKFAKNPPARETAHEVVNARAPIPPALLRRVQARRLRRRREGRNEGRTGLPDWLKKRIESRSQTANLARNVVQ